MEQHFTQYELDTMSEGVLALIKNAGEAKKLVIDAPTQKAIDKYVNELQALNTKICNMEG